MKFAGTTMRIGFAILCSVLLLGTEAISALGLPCEKSQSAIACGKCTCSPCPKSCCLDRQGSESHPQPAAPTHSTSQNDWQVCFLTVQQVLSQTLAEISNSALSFSSSASIAAVPLFLRNCCYLI
jgi:hypothetical protein